MFKTKMLMILTMFLSSLCLNLQAQTIRYVSKNGNNTDGLSWTTAYNDLQNALDDAVSGNEIWVAAGTYYPTSDDGLGIGLRGNHFQLKNGVSIYGGFSGSETNLSQRNIICNETILSGDIDQDDHNLQEGEFDSDNSVHVIYLPENLNLDNTAVLDGFTISGGNANNTPNSVYGKRGGGYFSYDSSPLIRQCYFKNNHAINGGAVSITVMENTTEPTNPKPQDTTPVFENCIFDSNYASLGGAAYNIVETTPEIIGNIEEHFILNPAFNNCLFLDNVAHQGAGAYNISYMNGSGNSNRDLYSVQCLPEFNNCTFFGNQSPGIKGYGAAIYSMAKATCNSFPDQCQSVCDVKVNNSLFSENYANNTSTVFSPGHDLYLARTGYHDEHAKLIINNSMFNFIPVDPMTPWKDNIALADNFDTSMNEPHGEYDWESDLCEDLESTQDYSIEICPFDMNIGDPLFSVPSNPAGADTKFGTADDGLTLDTLSPAKDAGNNMYANSATDLKGSTRIQGFSVDLGAYEFGGQANNSCCPCLGDGDGDGDVDTIDLGDFIALLPSSPPYILSPVPSGEECYDIDGDGDLDTIDLSAVIAHINSVDEPYIAPCMN